MYRYHDYKCISCGHYETIMLKRGEEEESQLCPVCDATMDRQFPAPMITKASYPDGISRGDRWELAKQSSRMEQEASLLRKHGKKEDAARLKREARQLSKRASTKRDKDDK